MVAEVLSRPVFGERGILLAVHCTVHPEEQEEKPGGAIPLSSRG
jgi:hypothetical protein